MTLASDRPPSPRPGGGEREVQRTLRVGVGGATGRVSRERSSRIGADLALKAAGTLSAPALELGNIIPEWVSNSGVLYNNSYDLPIEPHAHPI